MYYKHDKLALSCFSVTSNPGWYRARVSKYFQDGTCEIVYDDTPTSTVSEMVDLSSVDWIPCSKRAKRFVPLNCTPKSLKHKLKPSFKFYSSSEHCVKAYADDATLISDSLEAHVSVLQQVDQKAKDLDLYPLNPLNVSPICLTATVIEKKVSNYLRALLSQ